MKKLFSMMFKPAGLALLGVLLVALVFWFEAPLLTFDGKVPFGSASVRWFFILLLLALWAGYFGWKIIKARLANKRLMASLAPAPESIADPRAAPAQQAALAEQAALAQRMQQAMALLKKAAPGKKQWGAQYLYQLPWYVFVGAPGSGKTTTLMHSGLKFPLAEAMGPGAIGGVGGTRQCDWWFTDEAVLLDTAGRYTTQDSNSEIDQAEWQGFLGLLKKHRPRRPVNGIIVALSVADLLQQGPAARQAQAMAIRGRIKELHETLGSTFPIYVTVTKCDLLAGFVEFFDNLGREERAQVWGMTFPLAAQAQASAALASFPAHFLALEQRLQARVLDRVQQERDLQRRALLYRFPQQFAALGDVLAGFLTAVFEPNRFEPGSTLRGVYFSSGTQEGSPIDRVMASLAAAFGLDRKVLPPNAASGRSYFITALLKELMFKEAGLAGSDSRFEKRRSQMRLAFGVGVATLVLLLATGLGVSYVRNQNYVAQMTARSAALDALAKSSPQQGGVVGILPLLNAARELPGGYAGRDQGAPVLSRLGLSQADKLGTGAQNSYRRLLRSALLPRVSSRLEDVLRRGDANNQEYLYEALRVYLMLGQNGHLDADSVQAWLAIDWARNLADSTPQQRDTLALHVAAMLESGADNEEPLQLDASLITQTRTTLAMMPLPQRVYNRLKRAVAQAKLPEFSVSGAVGRDVSQVLARVSGEPLTRGISGLYSVAGYKELLKEAPQAMLDIAQDSWVLDRREAQGALDAVSGDQMRAAVLGLYYTEYILQWDALLADVRILPFSSLDQGARITNGLAAADSPLHAFLQAAAKETKLSAAAGKAPALDQAVLNKLAAARKKLEVALGADAVPAAGPVATNPVDRHFEPLHKLVGVPGTVTPAPLDAMLAMLKEVSVYFDAAENARKGGLPAPSSDALQRIKREADGKPAPLGAMLQTIDTAGAGLTLGSERARLKALWESTGAAFCREASSGRYPLVRGAAKDVTLDDFGKLFGPGGVMDDFFAKHLSAQVDMSGPQWKWRDAALGIPQETLTQFQRAARLREMFFSAGGRQPGLRFDLTPVSADPALTRVTLDVDGQPVVYTSGTAARPTAITLPSGKGGGLVRLEATPPTGAEVRGDGPWGWFRMLDKGSLAPTSQGERYKLAFDLGGRTIAYELTASSVINPFRRDGLEQFRCPSAW